MGTTRCRQLRPLLTPYVDHEVSADERLIVEGHLRHCEACRQRVSREEAVRRLLGRWSAEARAAGAPLDWPAGSEATNSRRANTLLRLAALSAATIAIMLVLWNRAWVDAGVPLVAQGHIGDSRCAGGHAHAASRTPGHERSRLRAPVCRDGRAIRVRIAGGRLHDSQSGFRGLDAIRRTGGAARGPGAAAPTHRVARASTDRPTFAR